jgi:hypothetical protein
MFGNIETLEVHVTNINHAFWIVTVAVLANALPQQQLTADDGGAYHVAQVFQIGGTGGWDYVTVDSRNKLLYLPRTTHTLVVDANNGTVKADIQGQKGKSWGRSRSQREPRIHYRRRGRLGRHL